MDEGVQQYRSTEGAILVDVREPEEYAAGHVPGSVNLPLSQIQKAENVLLNKSAPLFVYCLSGGRSGRAVAILTSMGYVAVTNIGGISSYHGEVER
jgi:rhodanese-related sulfurtransferase